MNRDGDPQFIRTAADLVAWFAFLIATTALAARFVPVVNHAVLIIAALSPYLMVGAAISTALCVSTHRWWAAAAAAVLTVAVIFVQLPRFVGSAQIPQPSVGIRVLTANLLLGSADPDALVAIARDRADILVVQELTPDLATDISSRGIESDFAYQALTPRPGGAGVGIWSRYPISRSSRDPGYVLDLVTVSVRPPGAASDVVVLGAHLAGPWPQPIDRWRVEMAKLPATLRAAAAAAGSGAVILAGDLNATTDMQPVRRLIREGFNDAADQSGTGLARTYPADRSVPPLIGIDHILTFNSSASNVATVRIPGSDHLGLVATVHVPGDSG